jgi:hypothetical protein
MARKKDPKQEKYESELIACMNELDRAMGRVIRWSNKLSALRTRRSRLQRELAKIIAAPVA